ncbi:MAG: penicillin-binding protein 2 [Patescibacteria group bacterium]|nr:penicillin-binding protein 2 [Patescibacteria group bacterium]
MFNSTKKYDLKTDDPFVLKHGGFKNGKLEKYSHFREWIESSFIPSGKIGEVVGRTFEFSRLNFFIIFIIVFSGLLLARVAWLQVIKGDYYSSMAEGNSVRTARIEAKRGIIYDRTGRPLVRNAANFILYLIPSEMPFDPEKRNEILAKAGAMIFPDDAAKKEALLNSLRGELVKIVPGSADYSRPIFIIDKLDYDKAMLVYLSADDMPGIVLSTKDLRQYLTGGVLSLSHILGYTGKVSDTDLERYGKDYSPIDYIGKAGVENSWESTLKGKSGFSKIEVDALGSAKKVLSEQPAVNGSDLQLSIDYDLQKKAEEILNARLKAAKIENKAAVVIMDPNNGEILTLISLPSYDNTLFARGITADEYGALVNAPDNPLFDRSISGEYPSGSTVKMVIAAAALQEKVISEHTTVNSTGGIHVNQWFFPDWLSGGHGITDVRRALAWSINTFFYYIGGGYENFVGLGVDRIAKYLLLFGLGMETGIDLPNESPGFVPSKAWKEQVRGESWYIGDTYHLAIGQGDLLVTPLQNANWTAVFANHGTLYQPHVVKAVLTNNDQTITPVAPKIIRQNMVDPYNIEVVRQGMRQVVTSGSAQKLQSLPVEAAAKTGTAQWGTDKVPHAWFTAFAPYKNPEIVVTVLVEEGIEGSQIALNVAQDIMQYYFTRGKNPNATSTAFNLAK